MKSQKPDGPVLDSGGSGFSRLDRIRLGFEIWFVLGRFSRIRVKELRPAAYISVGHGRLMYHNNRNKNNLLLP
jgi:hypothetical protein